MNLTGVAWVDWLLIAAAVITAVLTIWRKAIHPVIRVASVIEEAAPVLLDIAKEFKPNGGGSLRDSIDRIDARSERVEATLAEHTTALVDRASATAALAGQVTELSAYVHDFADEVSNQAVIVKQDLAIAVSKGNHDTKEAK